MEKITGINAVGILWQLRVVGKQWWMVRQGRSQTTDSRVGSERCAEELSCVQLFVTLWTVACQAHLSMEFFRQEYWSGLPFPPPGDLPNPGIGHLSRLLHCRQILYC